MNSRLRGGILLNLFVIDLLLTVILVLTYPATNTSAQTAMESGTVNIAATVQGSPPSTPAIITSPQNNAIVNTTPLVVMGTCEGNLSVTVYNQGAVAGTGTCSTSGTFIINIGLFYGLNTITALSFDGFGRPGPTSPSVSVTVSNSEQQDSPAAGSADIPSQPPRPLPVSSRQSRSNIFTRVASVIGVGTAVPVSGSEQVIYTLISFTIIFVCADMLLFNAMLSRRLKARFGNLVGRWR